MKTSHEMAQSVIIRQRKILRRRKAVLAAVRAVMGAGVIAGAFALLLSLSSQRGVDLVESNLPANSLTLPEKADPLDLLGCEISQDGEYLIDIGNWQQSEDFDLFRQYFFGTWESSGNALTEEMVIDDSEKAFLVGNTSFRFQDFYAIGENVLAFVMQGNAESELFWLDTDFPDTMYYEPYNGNWLYDAGGNNHQTAVYSRTAAPINAPEESFLSIYRLREISRDYGIDIDMLLNIEYNDKNSGEMLLHDDWYQFYPTYLLSEEPNRLVLKTTVGNVMAETEEIEVTCTIEKADGVWTRTEEFAVSDEEGQNICGLPSVDEDGQSLLTAAQNAAEAFLQGDRERLSEYLLDPEYDAGLSEDSANLFDELDYAELMPIDESITEFEPDRVYPMVYKFALKDRDMLSYLDMGLTKTENGWKLEYIYLQG